MTLIQSALTTVRASLQEGVQLVAVSKTKPVELLFEAYEAGKYRYSMAFTAAQSTRHSV